MDGKVGVREDFHTLLEPGRQGYHCARKVSVVAKLDEHLLNKTLLGLVEDYIVVILEQLDNSEQPRGHLIVVLDYLGISGIGEVGGWLVLVDDTCVVDGLGCVRGLVALDGHLVALVVLTGIPTPRANLAFNFCRRRKKVSEEFLDGNKRTFGWQQEDFWMPTRGQLGY